MLKKIAKIMQGSFMRKYANDDMFVKQKMPKSTPFGDFMGLTLQLAKLRQKQEKQEKHQVREYSGMLGILFLTIGCTILMVTQDNRIKIKSKLYYKQALMLLTRKEQAQSQLLKRYLTQIQQYLTMNPYEYKMILSELKHIVLSTGCSTIETMHGTLTKICSSILMNNKQSRKNRQLIEIIQKIVESSILKGFSMTLDLVNVMLQNGNIKQMYLIIRYLSIHKIRYEWNMTKIEQNLQLQIKKQAQYNSRVYNNIKNKNIQDLPQMAFKMQLYQQWIQSIKKYIQSSH